MKSIRFLDRRSGYSLASIGLLLGMVAPSLVPVFATAGTLTNRSIAMDSSTADAAGAEYKVTFTTSDDTQTVAMDFCDDSPIAGIACNAPSGFSVASASAAFTSTGAANKPSGTVSVANASANHIEVAGTGASTGSGTFVFTLSGVHNPTAVGSFYARIYTYAGAEDYTDETHLGTTLDTGSVALATTNDVGITAAVRETMTFCVSKTAPTSNCGGTDNPSLTLGEGTAPNIALDSTHLSTGTNYAQISTNAASGAVVNLKSNRTGCGGLVRVGAANCDIKPSGVNTNGNAAIGSALFGLTVGTPASASGATNPSGTFQAAGSYNSSTYYMDYVTGDATGVTSPYGSPVLNTNSLPINNKNIPLTFGASVSNTTPAGLYSATLNMIATGTF